MKRYLSWIWVVILPLILLASLFSPRLAYEISQIWGGSVRVIASTHACSLHRDGPFHTDNISCTLQYTLNGQPVETTGNAWISNSNSIQFIHGDSPDNLSIADTSTSVFTTLAALHRQLDRLNAGQKIVMAVNSDDPHQATAVPQWFGASRFSLVLVLYGVVLFCLACSLPSKRPERRADFDYDANGQLVRIREQARERAPLPSIPQVFFFLLLCALTLYGLSNSPANYLTLMGRMPLVEVPAQLEHCETLHYYYYGKGGGKGRQLKCQFAYQWENRRYEGMADTIGASHIDEAAQQAEGRKVSAWVDPVHPDYAIAFINNDFFVFQSWGVTELLLLFNLCFWTMRVWFPRILSRFSRRRQ